MKHRRTFITLVAMMIAAPSAAAAEIGQLPSCNETPTPQCLLGYVVSARQTIPADDPDRLRLDTELKFEIQQASSNLERTALTQTSVDNGLTRILQQEEAFLGAIKQRDWAQALQLKEKITHPLQDYLHSLAQTLYLETLILALQDADAEQFKKKYYETLLNQEISQRNQNMIDVARHEILGGHAEKGLHTLRNARIDEFSSSENYLNMRITELLATRSSQLFLQPDDAIESCTNTAGIANALSYFLQDEMFQSVSDSDEFPDPHLRILAALLLARLYHNSTHCPLIAIWLTHYAIATAIQTPSTSAQDLIELIHLLRAIRRYTA